MNFELYCTKAWKLSVTVGRAPDLEASQGIVQDMEKNMKNRGTETRL